MGVASNDGPRGIGGGRRSWFGQNSCVPCRADESEMAGIRISVCYIGTKKE